MRRSAKTRIIIWSVVSIVLFCSLTVGLWLSPQIHWSTLFEQGLRIEGADRSGYQSGSAELKVSEVKNLTVDWTSGEIEIKPSQDGKIRFTEERGGAAQEMCWLLSGGRLTIADFRTNVIFPSVGEKKLTLELPSDNGLDSLTVNAASADIHAERLNASRVELHAASGDASLGKVTAEEFTFQAASGNLNVSWLNADTLKVSTMSGDCDLAVNADYRTAKIDTVSGDVNLLVGKSAKTIRINTVSGTAALLTNQDSAGFTLTRSTISGNLDTQADGRTNGSGFVYKDGKAAVSCESVSGNVVIR